MNASSRLIEYIRHEKITFRGSYRFQDIDFRIKEIKNEEGVGFLTQEILEQLITDTFKADISPLCDARNIYEEAEDMTLPD